KSGPVVPPSRPASSTAWQERQLFRANASVSASNVTSASADSSSASWSESSSVDSASVSSDSELPSSVAVGVGVSCASSALPVPRNKYPPAKANTNPITNMRPFIFISSTLLFGKILKINAIAQSKNIPLMERLSDASIAYKIGKLLQLVVKY